MSYGYSRERTFSTASLSEDGGKRRQSSRAIKRPKFDDELVESSLGAQNLTPFTKVRTRNPSISTTSECSVSLPTTPAMQTESVRKRLPPKSSSNRKRKNRGSQAAMRDLGRWKPTDDLALIIGVQQTCDLVAVHRGIKFSCKFTLGEVQERWYSLLYDATVSRVAQQAMKNLHYDQIHAVQSKTLYGKAEEELLGTIPSTAEVSLQTFEKLLKENPTVFYSARTAKSIFTHWQLLKQYFLLPDQIPAPWKKGVEEEFIDVEKQIRDSDLNDPTDEFIKSELNICDRNDKKELRLLEEKVSRWQVIVDSVMGISPTTFDNQTIAVLKGRLVRYQMRSNEITIGRKAAGNNIDVDLSLEGPSWKVSRRQAVIKLRNTGEFMMANEGKRAIFIDGKPLLTGNKTKLNNNCVIEISSLRFVFLINQEIVSYNRPDYHTKATLNSST